MSSLSQHISELKKQTFWLFRKKDLFKKNPFLIIERTCTFLNFQSPKAQYLIRKPVSPPCCSKNKRQGISIKKNSKFYGQNHQSFRKRTKKQTK